MKLRRASIENFRSIKSMDLTFDPSCRVLVGINESGKTNILRALALLDPAREIAGEDLRDFPSGEELDQEAFVQFVFALDSDEMNEVVELLSSKVFTDKPGMAIATVGGKQLALKALCGMHNEAVYEIDIRNKTRSWNTLRLPSDTATPAHLAVPTLPPGAAPIQLPDGRALALSKFKLVDIRGHESELGNFVKPVTPDELSAILGAEIVKYAMTNHPTCIFWSYREDQLLPGKINTAQFTANPSMCPPLKCMFELAGVDSIPNQIAEAKQRPNGMRNLLRRVAEEATRHFHAAWREYRDIRFGLAENGAHIDAVIEDVQNAFDMSRRSDGFKRFMSFLLLISAKERANGMTDVLYIHDEPDVSLHPTGARYMRDELLRLSQTNVVVYSTHSIFMIDRRLPRRHLIVTKSNEITTVAEVDESNVQEEEVIFQALGTSVFEGLREWNLIFEGWRDKHLFDVALERWPGGKSDAAKKLAAAGSCYARGVVGVDRVTPMIQLARKKCIIVSDGDEAAVRAQREYEGQGKWVRYDELLPAVGIVTGEDFIVPSAWPGALAWARKSWAAVPEVDEAEFGPQSGRLRLVDSECESAGIPKEERKKILMAVKEFLFENLKRSQIESNYYDALTDLAKYMAAPE